MIELYEHKQPHLMFLKVKAGFVFGVMDQSVGLSLIPSPVSLL